MQRIIFFISVFLCVSCSKENSDPENPSTATTQWMIENVRGPDTGKTNDSIALLVSWPFASGCDVLDSFVQTQQGYEVYVKALGHTNYGFCSDNAGVKTATFYFFTASPGTYELKFLNPDNSYLLHIIKID